jgi:hypothetical protein
MICVNLPQFRYIFWDFAVFQHPLDVKKLWFPTKLHQLLGCTGSSLSNEGALEEQNDAVQVLRRSSQHVFFQFLGGSLPRNMKETICWDAPTRHHLKKKVGQWVVRIGTCLD